MGVTTQPDDGLADSGSDIYCKVAWRLIPFLCLCYLTASLVGYLLFEVRVAALIGMLAIGAVPVYFSLPATFLRGAAAASGFALATSLANIAGLVSNSLAGLAMVLIGSGIAAIWLFVGCLIVSGLLVYALPAKLVNR